MVSYFQRRARRRGMAILTATFSLVFASAVEASVEISNKPTQNMSCSGGVCTPTAQKAVLNVADLTGMLASGDLKISSGSQAQDIEIDSAVSWTSTSRLTLDAYHSISFNQPLVVAGTGALTIATNDGGTGGDFRFIGKGHVEFWDTRSSLIINGISHELVKSLQQIRTGSRTTGVRLALAKGINARKTYSTSVAESLCGTFEGLGNTISNLTIIDDVDSAVALFGELAESCSSVIRDIGLASVNIQGTRGNSQAVGALVAGNSGTVANAFATGQVSVSGQNSVSGGLVAINADGTVTHSFSAVAVSEVSGSTTAAGGLVGVNAGACHNGHCIGLVEQSYATGTVTGPDGSIVGGLVGENFGGIVSNSYATGPAAGGNNAFVGGLVGSNVNSPSEQADPVVTSSYSTGAVNGGSGATLGGLIGEDLADPGITDTYWDLDTSGISNPAQGAGNIVNDPGITGLTDAQLKSGLPAGFDKKVWKEKANINGGYPYLIDLPPG